MASTTDQVNPPLLTPFNTTSQSFNITKLSDDTPLTDNTTYNYWVKAKCANNDNTEWYGPYQFTTACLPVATLNENFNGITTLPLCWSKIVRGENLSVSSDIKLDTNTNSAIFRTTNSGEGTDFILVSPNLSTLTGNKKLRFSAYGLFKLQIVTLDSNTKSAAYKVFEELEIDNNGFADFTVDFSTYKGTDTYIGFRINRDKTYIVANIDNITFDQHLSTDQFDLSNFSYYPNPVKDILSISYENEISAVSVYNILGQEVLARPINGNWNKIDMSELSSGTYLVKINSGNSVNTVKVMKQ